MSLRAASAALALVMTMPAPVHAESGDDDTGDQIIVTGRSDGYRTVETTSGTKTSTPILDVPQSISVITATQLRDQAILTIADLVRYVPGVSSGQGEGHRDQITLRGNNSTADFFVDGLRDDVQYFRSLYNVERVEVHKGPNAMIFGRGGGGGILNRITKGALVDETFYSASVSANTFGSWYLSGDTNLDIGPAALRVNAFYETLDTHRDFFDGKRYGINPVVGTTIGTRAKVEIGYEYARDSRVVDRGVTSASTGTLAGPALPLAGFRDTFFGTPGVNESDFEAHIVRLRGEVQLTDALTLNTQALYGNYDKRYANTFAVTPAGGTPLAPTAGFEAYDDPTKRETIIAQANLQWQVTTGPVGHIILLGGEYTSQDSRNERINGFFDPVVLSSANRRRTIGLSDPVRVPPVFFRSGASGNGNRAVASELGQASFYAQDQISLGDKVDIIAGIRYDKFDLNITNLFTGQIFSRTDDLWSPRLGVVYKPVPQASVYASYAKSFLPQSGDQFLSLDLTGAALKPETFDNYEIGAKWDIQPGLSFTAAYYRLDRTNTRAAGPVAGTTVLTGAQRTRGVELGLTGRVTPKWQTSFGYAYTKADITKTTTAAPAGRLIAQVPRHQASLWNRYDMTDSIGIGVGIYHQSKQFTTISNTTVLPAYTRLDAALFFKFSETVQAQLNIENLADTTYFPVAHNDNNISTGAPVNARFTVSAKF